MPMSKRLMLRLALLCIPIAAGVILTLYLTNAIGCSAPPTNIASRKTLQKAGFTPCGHILHADLPPLK